MTGPNPAQRLVAALAEQAEDIDNLFVVYSRRNRPESLGIGSVGDTSVMWTLAALEYARWHLFSSMSLAAAVRATAEEQAVEELTVLKDSGGKLS